MIMALGFFSTACTVFWGFYSTWMHTFLSLDGGGKAFDFPQGRVPCHLLEQGGGGRGESGKKVGRVEILIDIISKVIKNLLKKEYQISLSGAE